MSSTWPKILVVGPVYLDRILEVNGPLTPEIPRANNEAAKPTSRAVLDHSVYEISRSGEPGDRLIIRNDAGEAIEIVSTRAAKLPLTGTISVDRPLVSSTAWQHRVGLAAHRQLPGGMGAGFAAALKAPVIGAIGGSDSLEADQEGQWLIDTLSSAGVQVTPQLFSNVQTDTTVLIISGPYGDKLPVGRRSVGKKLHCDSAVSEAVRQTDVLVIAGVHNRLTAQLIRMASKDCFIVFAPTWRNRDTAVFELASVADKIDYVSCNGQEWQELDGDSWLRPQIPLVTVTAGTKGATVYYRGQAETRYTLSVPAFRANQLPVDTNRAGESFASAFLNCLLEVMTLETLQSSRFEREVVQQAAREATVAAHLQVQTRSFEFYDRNRICAAFEREL